MAGNIVMATGLLMFICVQSGSSEVVPDGVVYTEVKKTLVQGVQGVLTCRFYKDPQAVYWTKGSSHHDASLMLLWHEGQVSGPRFNDGSCDIDENYSFIMKNVSLTDAGRYYCTVSNYLGILINNYTDVSVVDTAIETKSQVTLQMRPYVRGVVQCSVHIRPRTVSWIKQGTANSSDETLAIFENNGTVVKRSGIGYDEGLYNITENYSLVINDVRVHNEGIYTCNVTDFDTGIAFEDDTLVSVVAQPREPFPTILECLHDESDPDYCSIPAETALTLTCQVSEYYPDINLIFLYGSSKVEILGTTERNNTDGTKNKTITIAALGSEELYTCVASNIQGTLLSRSTSALLRDREDFNKVLVAVLTCFATLILFSSMAYYICRRKHHHSDRNYTQVSQVELQCSDSKDVKDLTARLTDEEKLDLLELVNNVLMKHYRKIYDLIYTKSPVEVETIIHENRIALFDTEKMLNDWHQNPESTRRQCIKAMQVATTPVNKSDNVWPFNEELKWISRHVKQESMKEICKKLRITYKPEDNYDEDKRYNSLCKWRNKVEREHVDKKHSQLSSAIGSKNLGGLLPPLKGRFIYKAELVDMAFNLLMSDLLPVAEALGINATKLVSYRPAFQPSHLEMGTIDLLSKLLNSVIVNWPRNWDKEGIRLVFYSRIGRLTYYNVIAGGLVAYDMSYGELHAISEVMASTRQKAGIKQGDASRASTLSEEDKCEKGAASKMPEEGNKEETDNEKNPESKTPVLVVSVDQMSEPEKAAKDTETKDTESEDQRTGIRRVVEISEDLYDLLCALQLTDQDIAAGFGSSHPITAHALFKIWKEKPRPLVFNYRAALAQGLRGIEIPHLADDIIAGTYIKEDTSLTFIKNMIKKLKQDQLISLAELLRLNEKDGHWHTSTPFDVISKQICDWVVKWTKEMENSRVLKAVNVLKDAKESILKVSKKHRDLNDKLVKHGFLDLAREVMIIEQQME